MRGEVRLNAGVGGACKSGSGAVCALRRSTAACAGQHLTPVPPSPPPLPVCPPRRSEKCELAALHLRAKKELGDIMAALQQSYADTRAEAAAAYRLQVGVARWVVGVARWLVGAIRGWC